jgi:Amt family ammonium transporter
VGATPASGIIPPWASIILGVTVGFVSSFSTKGTFLSSFLSSTPFNLNINRHSDFPPIVKLWLRIDVSMDNLAEHGITGMVGLLFNGLFATDYMIGQMETQPASSMAAGSTPTGNNSTSNMSTSSPAPLTALS